MSVTSVTLALLSVWICACDQKDVSLISGLYLHCGWRVLACKLRGVLDQVWLSGVGCCTFLEGCWIQLLGQQTDVTVSPPPSPEQGPLAPGTSHDWLTQLYVTLDTSDC